MFRPDPGDRLLAEPRAAKDRRTRRILLIGLAVAVVLALAYAAHEQIEEINMIDAVIGCRALVAGERITAGQVRNWLDKAQKEWGLSRADARLTVETVYGCGARR